MYVLVNLSSFYDVQPIPVQHKHFFPFSFNDSSNILYEITMKLLSRVQPTLKPNTAMNKTASY